MLYNCDDYSVKTLPFSSCQVLIEKEWLSFGHKFTIRSGHLQGELKETSPIFTQFLDATWQVYTLYVYVRYMYTCIIYYAEV